MVNARKWLAYGVSATFVLASISCVIMVLQALCKKANTKAGIATIQFDLVGANPNTHLRHKRELIQSFETGAESAAKGIPPILISQAAAIGPSVISQAAAIGPSVISQVKSATDTLTTAIPDAVEALIPRNCSVGTKEFCVGLAHIVSCHRLPLDISQLIPAKVEEVLQINLDDIKPLHDALAKVTTANVQGALAAGVSLIILMATLSACFALGKFFCLSALLLRSRVLRVGLLLLFGLICCFPFLISTVILHTVKSKTENLPHWIQVQGGEVSRLSLGGLICAIIMLVLGTIAAIFF